MKEESSTKPLEIVHTDLHGPTKSKGLVKNTSCYLLTTIPGWHGYVFSIGSHKLLDVSFKELVENETRSRNKCLRSDNGGEFTSDKFNKYYEEHGIKRLFSVSRKPQQNGVVERKNRSVMEMARTMLNESKLNENFWGHAIHTTVWHIKQRITKKHKW